MSSRRSPRKSVRLSATAAVVAVSLVALAPTAGAQGSAAGTSAGRPPKVEDVTATHQRDIAASAERFAAEGVDFEPSALRAVRVSGAKGTETVILPAGVVIEVSADGDVGFRIDPATAPLSPSGRAEQASKTQTAQAAAVVQPYWYPTSNGCFARTIMDGAYIDACYRTKVMLYETDSSRTYQSLEQWATAGPYSNPLSQAWIMARALNSNAEWSDWSPRSDYTGGCSSVNVSVSAFGVSVGNTVDRCETWDITKPAAPTSNFTNHYKWGKGWPGCLQDREVAQAMVVKVPQQGTTWKGWYLSRSVDGYNLS